MLLHEKIRDAYVHPQFIADVIKPLQIEQIMDQEVSRVFSLGGVAGIGSASLIIMALREKTILSKLIDMYCFNSIRKCFSCF